MQRRSASLPAYRRRLIHGNARAVVTLSDASTGECRDFYLGPYGEASSREQYLQILAEWESAGRRLPEQGGKPATLGDGRTVTELCNAFWQSVESGYSPSHRYDIQTCIKILRSLYGETFAEKVGPKALRLIRREMINLGWSRRYVNRQIGVIRQIFRWGVSHELVPIGVLEALRTVEPLKRGRCDAPERLPVRPVSSRKLDATLPHLNRQVRAVVELQLLTGARPAELLDLRPCDFEKDDSPDVWTVHLVDHKTAHHGRSRVLYFGPQAQAILKPFLVHRADTTYLFNPSEAEAERRAAMHANRTTPMSCGNKPGSNTKETPQRRPRDRYTTASYRRAIDRACEKAFPPPKRLQPRKDETRAKFEARLTENASLLMLKQRVNAESIPSASFG